MNRMMRVWMGIGEVQQVRKSWRWINMCVCGCDMDAWMCTCDATYVHGRALHICEMAYVANAVLLCVSNDCACLVRRLYAWYCACAFRRDHMWMSHVHVMHHAHMLVA